MRIGEKIIHDESKLSPKHVPSELKNREKEMKKIKEEVVPVSKRSRPVMVYGETGTGKTVAVKKLLNELEDETTAHTVYIDCWEYRTKTAILNTTLIDLGIPVPRKGKPVDVLYEKLENQVERKNLVLVLDEFDLQEVKRSDILYTLGELVGKGLNLILITCEKDFLKELDMKVRTRLAPLEVEFTNYNKEELTEILENRTKEALKPNTFPKESILEVSEIASKFRGNCKLALALLEVAARLAERKNKNTVTPKLVKEAAEKFDLCFKGDKK